MARSVRTLQRALAAALSAALVTALGAAPGVAQEPDYPPMEKVVEGFQKIDSRSPDQPALCNIWTRDRDGQMFVELPKDFEQKKYFLALTVSSGDEYAGLQAGDYYVYWRMYNKRLALIMPNTEIRSTGEEESKSSVRRLFTDTVLLDVPIVTMVPRGGPLIDADSLFVGQAAKLFGSGIRATDPGLVKIKKAKAFSKNIELAFEIVGNGGKLQTIHYSLSEVPEQSGYKPRKADERIGYFTTGYSDLGIYQDERTRVRFINRWRLEKRDPNLKVSPPVKPIRFYIEHTTPVRYRRWVKEGIEYWNKAFENVGYSDAIEVVYQDSQTGANMDLDPEDVQYNFVRWLNNNVGTAIGPSRVHPLTGEILDADIILTDGWIRHFNFQFQDLLPEVAMEGMSPETMAWLATKTHWDPRVRFADASNQAHVAAKIAATATLPHAGHPLANAGTSLIGDDPFDGLVGRTSQVNGFCLAARGKQLDMAFAQMAFAMAALAEEGEKSDKPKEEMLDGMPESFIGPLLAELVAHEVGHTLGLRHNFKASSVFKLDEINSEAVKGKKPLAGSVMDYLPINIPLEAGPVKGDWTMIGIGPYDMWAIEYGYTPDEGKLPEVLKRVNEPELQFATDEDTGGADPLARRYDYSKDPLDYAQNQMRLVKMYRDRLLEKFVKPGDSWAKARRGYELTLSEQTKALSMMAGWVGGANIIRDKKGDPGDRKSLTPVPVDQQRKALDFMIQQSFRDEAFGLSPAIQERLASDKWIDEGARSMGDGTYQVNDRIMGIQASVMTMLLNPSTLRRVFDNEQMIPADQDAVTLPEVLDKVTQAAWTELDAKPEGESTTRKPRVSSLRRNLQREHLGRLVDLTLMDGGNAAQQTIRTLAAMQLKEIKKKVDAALEAGGLDAYSSAHLSDAQRTITKVLDANFVANMPASIGGGGGPMGIFFQAPQGQAAPVAPAPVAPPAVVPAPAAPAQPAVPATPEGSSNG
ncbi:MAG: zinc-dependent metalloprotease [Pirellulaceae bacterium]